MAGSGRILFQHMPGPEFKSDYWKKTNEKEKREIGGGGGEESEILKKNK